MGFCPKNISERTQIFPKITFPSIFMDSSQEKKKRKGKKDLQMVHISNVLLSPKQ